MTQLMTFNSCSCGMREFSFEGSPSFEMARNCARNHMARNWLVITWLEIVLLYILGKNVQSDTYPQYQCAAQTENSGMRILHHC